MEDPIDTSLTKPTELRRHCHDGDCGLGDECPFWELDAPEKVTEAQLTSLPATRQENVSSNLQFFDITEFKFEPIERE